MKNLQQPRLPLTLAILTLQVRPWPRLLKPIPTVTCFGPSSEITRLAPRITNRFSGQNQGIRRCNRRLPEGCGLKAEEPGHRSQGQDSRRNQGACQLLQQSGKGPSLIGEDRRCREILQSGGANGSRERRHVLLQSRWYSHQRQHEERS